MARNSRLGFVAKEIFGVSEDKDTDLSNIITRLESLPIKTQNSKESDCNPYPYTHNDSELTTHSTEAVSIPIKNKVLSAVSAPMNSASPGITFGMGSSWKSNRRIRSSASESGYGSSLNGSSVKSSLSLLDHKEESEEKQSRLDNLPLISLRDVQEHCYEDDAWMVFYDRVYNVTDFLIQVSFNEPKIFSILFYFIYYNSKLSF